MLEANSIPSSEPLIDVGIILPEDGLNKVSLTLPAEPLYRAVCDGKASDLQPGSQLSLSFDHGILHLESGLPEQTARREIRIEARDPQRSIAPKSGIRVSPVVAGRGFHWQKKIDVYLPDTLIFRHYEDSMTLTNELPLEHYVMCVATSEMSAACPAALIESQTIAARSWLLANVEQKHKALGMDICNDDCCQRYQGSTFLSLQSIQGALSTNGQVLMYGEAICDARYSKSCGGMMESFDAVWPGYKLPYMVVKPDAPEAEAAKYRHLDLRKEAAARDWITATPRSWCSPAHIPETELIKYLGNVDQDAAYFRWKIEIRQQELTAALKKYARLNIRAVLSLLPEKRGGSGRATELSIVYYPDESTKTAVYKARSEYEIRRILSEQFLYSSAIVVKLKDISGAIPGIFEISGAGWGHGAGLCQIGALGMALHNKPTEEILAHYYPNSYLKKIYD